MGALTHLVVTNKHLKVNTRTEHAHKNLTKPTLAQPHLFIIFLGYKLDLFFLSCSWSVTITRITFSISLLMAQITSVTDGKPSCKPRSTSSLNVHWSTGTVQWQAHTQTHCGGWWGVLGGRSSLVSPPGLWWQTQDRADWILTDQFEMIIFLCG